MPSSNGTATESLVRQRLRVGSLRALALALVLAVLGLAPPASSGEVPTAIIDSYLKIQSALAADRADGVPAVARVLAADARALGASGSRTQQAAAALAATSDLTGARTAFGELSDALIALVGAEVRGVRKAYCPMVKKFWLQKSAQIENPYYGSEMLRCGSFEK
jgi:hypothetical protein